MNDSEMLEHIKKFAIDELMGAWLRKMTWEQTIREKSFEFVGEDEARDLMNQEIGIIYSHNDLLHELGLSDEEIDGIEQAAINRRNSPWVVALEEVES